MASNIYKLYLIKISKWFMLFMPIIVPFFKDNGLDMQEIMTLQAVLAVTILLWEVPSGYFSDVWSRRTSMIVGSLMGVGGVSVYSVASDFESFVIAVLLNGMGVSFISGTDSALLYDTLLEENKAGEYLRYESKVSSFGNFAEGFAALLGGFLATYSLRTPFYGQILVALVAVVAAFTLIEPKNRTKFAGGSTFDNLKLILTHSLVTEKMLRWFILFSSGIGAATVIFAWMVQPYLEAVNINIANFGWVWAYLQFTVGIASWNAHWIKRQLGNVGVTLLIGAGIGLGYLLLGVYLGKWAIGFIFAFYFIRGIATPILKDFVNAITPSEMRATILSIRSLMVRAVQAVLGIGLGWATDFYSLQTAFLIGGVIFLIFGLLCWSVLLTFPTFRSVKTTE